MYDTLRLTGIIRFNLSGENRIPATRTEDTRKRKKTERSRKEEESRQEESARRERRVFKWYRLLAVTVWKAGYRSYGHMRSPSAPTTKPKYETQISTILQCVALILFTLFLYRTIELTTTYFSVWVNLFFLNVSPIRYALHIQMSLFYISTFTLQQQQQCRAIHHTCEENVSV